MRFIAIIISCLITVTSFSQNIDGPQIVSPGTRATYSLDWESTPPMSGILWSVDGGEIIGGGDLGIEVQWYNDVSSFTGTILISDADGNFLGDYQVLVGTPYLTPLDQTIFYGEPYKDICLNVGWLTPENIVWEQSTDLDNWTDVNDPQTCHLIPALSQTTYFRCTFDVNGETFTTDPASVNIAGLTPGTISLVQQPAFNTAANISNTAGTGGYCYAADYQYTWEESVEGGPWTVIGSGAAYPAGAPPITANTSFRRKITCSGESLYSNTLDVKPSYTGVDYENRNYVRTNTIATRGVQSWYQADQLDIGKKFQQTVYFDGLDRSIQTVNKGISSTPNNVWEDLVSFTNYDNLGRPVQNNLPYATTSELGKFKTSTSEQVNFYTANYNESSPWGKNEYEDNPLGRVTKVIDPGAYRLNNGKGNSFDYDFNNSNSVAENVHIWRIGYNPGDLPVTSNSATDIYQTGTLVKTIVTDERGKQVIEYRDLMGNAVLKKVQLKESGAGLTNEHDGWLCTYYVYDDFNRVRFIITPKAVAYLDTHNWVLTQEIANELCFSYEYDGRGRATSKKSPGVAKINIVYDQRDRVVFTQDGNQLNKEWLVNFYDDLNRLVEMGIYKSTETRGQLQPDMDNAGVATTITAGGSSIAVTLNAQPPVDVNNTATYTAQIYRFYDDYNFAGVKSFSGNYNNLQAYGPSEPDIKSIAKTDRVRGLSTGSKVRVLNSSTFLASTVYYDEDGSILQTLGDNYKSGTDVVTLQHHFDGRIMSSYTQHGDPGNSDFNGFGILTKNIYDKTGRLVTLQKKFGSADFKKIADYQYDELGHLKTKKLGKKPNTADDPLETIDYSYNVNGLLTGINKDYALSGNNTDQWNNYFGEYLGYENFDNQFTNQRFDHLITGLIWKTQGDNTPRKYDFTYDNAGRYTAANFTQKTAPSETSWSNAKADFSENDIDYDENGNLKKLTRKGIVAGNATPLDIDKLVYTYKATAGGEWSNQLLKVFDNNPTIGAMGNGKLGDFQDEVFNTNTDDYTYDDNGNLVLDNNKKIRNGSSAGITYNFLNKPDKIILENKSTVEYTYDAMGIKLAKRVTPASGAAKTTYYLGDFVYEDNSLQYILHEEGRVRVMSNVNSTSPLGAMGQTITGNIQLTSNKWGVFDYFIKDHLGSTRMVLTEEYHQEIFKCTMEVAAASEEETIFGKVDNNGNVAPGNEVYDSRIDNTDWSNNSSAKVSKLVTTGSPTTTHSIGPNVLLKVMAGDYVSAYTDYYYQVPPSPVNNSNILSSIVTSIIGGLTGGSVSQSVKDGAGALQTTLQDVNASPLVPFLNGRPVPQDDRPKAYLNYIFFDENFNYVEENSGAIPVDKDHNDYYLTQPNIRVPKNGYVYVYLSNESDWAVEFDNFKVTHERGAIIEENHYYPQGLKIAGISSRAFNKLPNKYGFQGDFSEEEEESGYDEFDLRMYDAQTGRWIQSDPYDEFASGYVGMGNDPVNNTDPDGGGISDGAIGALIGSAVGFAAPYIYEKVTGNNVDNKGLWGVVGAVAGAGIGYGIGAYLEDNISIWTNTRAFYEGLFGGGDGWVHAMFDQLDRRADAIVPDVWGSIGSFFSLFRHVNIPDIPDMTFNSTVIRGIINNTTPIQIPTPPYQPMNIPTPHHDHPRHARAFRVRGSVGFNGAPTVVDQTLSREQIGGTNSIIGNLQRRAANNNCATFIVTSINVTIIYPARFPLSTAVVGNGGGVLALPNGIRVDDPFTGPPVNFNNMRPANGVGNTPAQNLTQQAIRMGIRIANRLGSPGARVTGGIQPGSNYRVQVSATCICIPAPPPPAGGD